MVYSNKFLQTEGFERVLFWYRESSYR